MGGNEGEASLAGLGLPALIAVAEAADLSSYAVLGVMNQPRVRADTPGWEALRRVHDDLVRLRDRASDCLESVRPRDSDEAGERARHLYARAIRRGGTTPAARLAIRVDREGWG